MKRLSIMFYSIINYRRVYWHLVHPGNDRRTSTVRNRNVCLHIDRCIPRRERSDQGLR